MTQPIKPLDQLYHMGQSIWLDYIRRDLFENGELEKMIQKEGLRGMTSNPSIFEKAIAETNLYDASIPRLSRLPDATESESNKALFYQLAIEDVQNACDLFAPLYQKSQKEDGYVSLEVSPDLAHDPIKTIAEAHDLWEQVNRPNLMIKVPGTAEGLDAISKLLADGLNINVTLLFSVDRYQKVLESWMNGLQSRLKNGQDISSVHSVASFFVSRLDVKIDRILEEIGTPEALALKGKAAVANAQKAYQIFQKTLATPQWQTLALHQASPQRLLWASTSVKNPEYSPLLYVETLIGKHTVNTLPPSTYHYLLDHLPSTPDTIPEAASSTEKVLNQLSALGIDLDNAVSELETEGVAAFSRDFHTLLSTLQDRCLALSQNNVR